MANIMKRENRFPLFPSVFDRFWNDDLFSKVFSENIPAANVIESPADFKVELSVPGFEKNDVKVEVDKNVLKLSAEREAKKEEKDAGHRVIRQEFSVTTFSRSFTLPENIDTGGIQAKLADGVLRLVLPKMKSAPENKIRNIAVQ